MTKNQKIVEAYENGMINSYMLEKLTKASSFGVNSSLMNDIVDDAINASALGVSSDNEYNMYFFTKKCLPDMLKDTFGISPDSCDQRSIQAFILNHKDDKNYDLKNLVDHRLLIHKWFCNNQIEKKAHPNIGGKTNADTAYDVDKWVDTLKQIYSSVHSNVMDRDSALNHFTTDWDSDERQKFSNWVKYYEAGNTNKYNIKNASIIVKEGFSGIPQSWVNPADRNTAMEMSTYKPVQKSDKELKQERALELKRQVQSRVRALRKLVDKYNEALPHQDLTPIYDEVHSLERSISKLNVFASIEDVLFRSANRMRKMGFVDGADILTKVADGQLVDNLPTPISPEPNLVPGSKPQVHINMIIHRLEGVSKVLKSRDTIRELASIDILLNELGIASHFPELTDAQAKLIESFGYASNKIESIVAKLRGSGSARPSPAQSRAVPKAAPIGTGTISTPPIAPKSEKVNTEELKSKPIAEVQKTLPKE